MFQNILGGEGILRIAKMDGQSPPWLQIVLPGTMLCAVLDKTTAWLHTAYLKRLITSPKTGKRLGERLALRTHRLSHIKAG